MKSSIKFREENSPLIRTKLPFKLGPLPLSSGIAVGTKQDLSAHLAMGFLTGPIIKLAVRPHDPNPLSVMLKTGLGSWCSPNDAPLIVTAEICINHNGLHHPLLSLRLKPRAGDFSIRKDVKNLNFASVQRKEAWTASASLPIQDSNNVENPTASPRRRENGSALNLLSNGDAKPAFDANGLEKENMLRPSADSNPGKTNMDLCRKEEVEPVISENDKSAAVQLPHERLSAQKRLNSSKFAASFSFAGVQEAISGCKIVTHSSLPLGSRARLNVRWGVKSVPDFFQGWDGSLASLSISKLPALILDKVSLVQGASSMEKESRPPITNSSEQERLPLSFVEDNQELSQVASMCSTMKRQLHLMHAENQVLRRAMEDMRSQVETKAPSMPTINREKMPHMNNDSASKLPQASSILDMPVSPTQQGREGTHYSMVPRNNGGRCDAQAQKINQKAKPKKEDDLQVKPSISADENIDLSKELERAILNAQSGPAAGKKD